MKLMHEINSQESLTNGVAAMRCPHSLLTNEFHARVSYRRWTEEGGRVKPSTPNSKQNEYTAYCDVDTKLGYRLADVRNSALDDGHSLRSFLCCREKHNSTVQSLCSITLASDMFRYAVKPTPGIWLPLLLA